MRKPLYPPEFSLKKGIIYNKKKRYDGIITFFPRNQNTKKFLLIHVEVCPHYDGVIVVVITKPILNDKL